MVQLHYSTVTSGLKLALHTDVSKEVPDADLKEVQFIDLIRIKLPQVVLHQLLARYGFDLQQFRRILNDRVVERVDGRVHLVTQKL